MPEPLELVRALPEALLERERVALDPEARPVERRLRVEPVVDERRHELHVRLRLDEAAHDAERAEQPPSRRSIPGMIVWYGRRPGSTAPATEKQAPRFWSTTPVPGATTPEPKVAKRLWMSETAIRSPSTAQR